MKMIPPQLRIEDCGGILVDRLKRFFKKSQSILNAEVMTRSGMGMPVLGRDLNW